METVSLEKMLNPHLQAVKPYVPGKPIDEVAKEFHLKKKEVVKMASNENPLGPSPKAIEAMEKTLGEVHLYPDGAAKALRQAIASRLKISPDQVILGNGSNEILEFVTTAFLQKGDSVVTADHTFSLYETFSKIVGASVNTVPLKDHTFDLEAISRQITSTTKIIFLCNPNNPTGTVVSHESLEKFVEELQTPTLVVIDEAYGDFRDDGGFAKSLEFLSSPNVLLLRTYSKLFGLAGLRIGYGLAHPKLIEVLNRVRQPFNVNALAQTAALAALKDSAHEKKSLWLVRDEKKFLTAALKKMNLLTVPSQTNFLCVRVGKGKAVYEKMLEEGVIIRPLDSFGMPEYIRVTIGTRLQNEKFLQALKQVL